MKAFRSLQELVHGFDEFVLEGIPKLAAEEAKWFDETAGSDMPRYVLYGYGILGKMLLRGMQRLGLAPLAIVDANLSSQTAEIEGIPCLSPARACAELGENAVFIVAVFNQSGDKAFTLVKASLLRLGARRVVYFLPFLWKHAEVFLPYYSLDRPSNLRGQEKQILRVYRLLADSTSRNDYAAFLYHLVCPDPTFTYFATASETYFPADLIRLSNTEVFLDGGAFDGDTLARFLEHTGGRFASYIGVEPDPQNFAALEARIAALRPALAGAVETRRSAIGGERGELRFAGLGLLGSAFSPEGNITVPVSRIDELLGGIIPTYVKLDIEGAELDALSGAKAFLSRARPKLAVCLYHRQDHLWEIPRLMHAIDPEYRLFVRRHREYFDDVVAYAVA